MDVTMTFETQSVWTWWFALYLYLGGLGAAILSVTFLTDMYLKRHPVLVMWGTVSGIVMLGVGSSMLFIHLLDHMAVIHVLNPLTLWNNPEAWIAWGTQFIFWMMVWGVVYSLHDFVESAFFNRIPLFGAILRSRPVRAFAGHCNRFRKTCGWLATINGIGTAVYTGLLLQSFPAVALWHNPGVPLLFTVSAFSTALAFLLLVLHVFVRRQEDDGIRVLYERIDLILIATELVILFSFFFYLQRGSEAALRSAQLLWNDMGWLIGFIGFGLIVPFLIELRSVLKHRVGRVPIVTAAVLVLCGGYLLRHYFMAAGVYAHPW